MEMAALAAFALVASITPGPNNLMLAASGMRFGFLKSLPHALGIQFGMSLIFIACCYGVGQTLLQIPAIRWLLSLIGSVYLLYLLWNIFNLNGNHDTGEQHTKPMTCWQATNFQFVNPKTWIVGVMAASLFLPSPQWQNISALIGTFIAMNMFSVTFWLLCGKLVQVSLANPSYRFGIQGGLTCLTVFTVVSLWIW